MSSPLTEVQAERARELRRDGMTWKDVAEAIGCASYETVRRAIDVAYVERKRADGRTAHHRRAAGLSPVQPSQTYTNPAYDPRRDGPPQYRSPMAEFMGEPPIGRSALDQKRGAG